MNHLIRPMLATLTVQPFTRAGWVNEEKYDGEKLRFAGKVGTGYSEDVLADLAHKMSLLRTTQSPFQSAPQIKDVTWVRPNLVAQIAFAEWTDDGKLRQPAFLGLRNDQEPFECQWGERE